ncbi:hypothetical protein NL676_029552, partial [Syzygium grande]
SWMRNMRNVERLSTAEDIRSAEYSVSSVSNLSLDEKYEECGKIIQWSSQPSLHAQTATFCRLPELNVKFSKIDAQNSMVTIGTSSKKSHSFSLIEFGSNKKISLQYLTFVLQIIPLSSLFGKISREDQMQTLS